MTSLYNGYYGFAFISHNINIFINILLGKKRGKTHFHEQFDGLDEWFMANHKLVKRDGCSKFTCSINISPIFCKDKWLSDPVTCRV